MILILTVVQVVVIDQLYAWARQQNSHLTATLRELIDDPMMSILGGAIGLLGVKLRVWSWMSVAYAMLSTLWIARDVWADDGWFLTRASYEEMILRLALCVAILSAMAAFALSRRVTRGGLAPSRWTIAAAVALVPVWCVGLLFMR